MKKYSIPLVFIILLIIVAIAFFIFGSSLGIGIEPGEGNGSTQNYELVTIEPELVDCTGVGPQKCMIVNGEYFYDTIKGFEYEEGYTYVLKVESMNRPEPIPADAGGWHYQLVEIVSKTSADEVAEVDQTQGLVGKTWTWIYTTIEGEGVITPQNSDAFTLTFEEDGSVNGTTDCNNFSGTYGVSVVDLSPYPNINTISFGPMMQTLMYCEGSQEAEFTQGITEASTYNFDEQGILMFVTNGSDEFMRFK